jgi:transcriptional repressor NrdR
MLCPACGHDGCRVIKTREDENSEAIHRVRECRSCGHVWRTREAAMAAPPPRAQARAAGA